MDARQLIESAFVRLAEIPGFVHRENQIQLALTISDLIEGKSCGIIEAPTGLGKSLAVLIAAMAHVQADGTRTVVATYTNVLSEQYWRKDLVEACRIFPEFDRSSAKFLIGRQRYACLVAMEEHLPEHRETFQDSAELGIETEFRQFAKRYRIQPSAVWPKISVPAVCAGRNCPAYEDCFYYSARREALKAKVVLTNHSVVIQGALLSAGDEPSDGLLGSFDFLILDEGHDFIQAAINGLEVELDAGKIAMIKGLAHRYESLLLPTAQAAHQGKEWLALGSTLRNELEKAERDMIAYALGDAQGGIVRAAPVELDEHPALQARHVHDGGAGARTICDRIAEACYDFLRQSRDFVTDWKDSYPGKVKPLLETAGLYERSLMEFGSSAQNLFEPDGVSVSHVSNWPQTRFRKDLVGLSEPLEQLVWNTTPCVLLSATLAVDGEFDLMRRTLGFKPDHEDIYPTPFNFASQAALYLPKSGLIPDPGAARQSNIEASYYKALADQLSQIIRILGGRTLALFHSRKEMEGVFACLDVPPEFPVLVQGKSATADIGERFRAQPEASLFGLRSFWTGFDAPGETLSCVAIVRIPFEVPIEPSAIARMAHLSQQGLDPFAEWTLPMAKMLIRQGAGRLIRRDEDRGVIAILDPRIRTKPYGESILANLPEGIRQFDDIEEAAAHVRVLVDA